MTFLLCIEKSYLEKRIVLFSLFAAWREGVAFKFVILS